MATIAELETALRNADKAGDTDAARKLAAVIIRARKSPESSLPDYQIPETVQAKSEPSMADEAIGAGEAALTMGTGALAAPVATANALRGLIGNIMTGSLGTKEGQAHVEKMFTDVMQGMTYAPRTQAGQEDVQAIGELGAMAEPLIGLGPQGAALAGAAKALTAPARIAAGAGVAKAGQVATRAGELVARPVEAAREAVGATSKSVGSAATPMDLQRVATAESMPVPISLTKGAASRDPAQLAFEKEQMKGALGQPLRNRAEENNLQLLQNFDTLVDKSGAEGVYAGPTATGNKIVDVLAKGYGDAKSKTRKAYNEALNSEEANATVDLTKPIEFDGQPSSLVDYLNSRPSGLESTKVASDAKRLAINLGVLSEADDGRLVANPVTVKQMEALRREISGIAKRDDATGIRDETIIKKMIDAHTEPVAGELFKQARSLRESQARKYESRAIVARLITNRKGMDDPKVAADQVFQKSIIGGSPEEITFLKRVLMTNGDDGRQAWKEIQGALVDHIKAESTKGVGTDSNGNPLVSVAQMNKTVGELDKNGRLDVVLGKQTAQTIRDLNELSKVISTVPPGTLVNTSGTAGVLAAMAEAGATGTLTGIPLPVVSILRAAAKQIRDNKTKARIMDALKVKD